MTKRMLRAIWLVTMASQVALVWILLGQGMAWRGLAMGALVGVNVYRLWVARGAAWGDGK